LETPEAEKDVRPAKPRFRGTPLYCRFKVFDPCQILQRLVPWTGFFYTSFFVLLSAAVILTAAGVTVAQWGDFRQTFPPLRQLALDRRGSRVEFFGCRGARVWPRTDLHALRRRSSRDGMRFGVSPAGVLLQRERRLAFSGKSKAALGWFRWSLLRIVSLGFGRFDMAPDGTRHLD